MIFLHLESFENKLFELDFSIFQKACLYGQTHLRRWFFFARLWHFFRDPCSFPCTKKLLNVSDHFVEKIRHESTTLRKPYLKIRTVIHSLVYVVKALTETLRIFGKISERPEIKNLKGQFQRFTAYFARFR